MLRTDDVLLAGLAAADNTELSLDDSVSARRSQAQAVLRSLMAAKTECEAHLQRFKRPDVIKTLTGRSALDEAITSTRRLIEQLDAQIDGTASSGYAGRLAAAR